MPLRRAVPAAVGSVPLVTELTVVVCSLVGLNLWRRVVTALQPSLLATIPERTVLPVGPLLVGGVLLAGVVCYGAGYAVLRGIDVGLRPPAAADRRTLGLAVGVPLGMVALTKTVAVFTGVPYNAFTTSAYSAGTPVTAVPSLLGPGLLVGALSLTVVCQVLVQGTFARVVDGRRAALLTTVFAAVVLTSSTGGLTAFPDRGKLALATVFVVTLALALYAVDEVDREWLQYLAYLPVSAVLGLVVLSWANATDSLAELLFGATHAAVLGLAATGYERTDSLVVPAAAYLTVLLANEVVVVLFEAGMQSW
ncbi:hypothetical protein ACFR97_05275 [Haloplanus litoreus]|uniref:Uncharacterized protein n=2 Tax=Haloplanus litoreus TaxID=767515 RepID=A0ABD6A290_9EURY